LEGGASCLILHSRPDSVVFSGVWPPDSARAPEQIPVLAPAGRSLPANAQTKPDRTRAEQASEIGVPEVTKSHEKNRLKFAKLLFVQ
jgi:hypothetical protein